MPQFSNTSKARLETCHPDLQALFNKIVSVYDCSILEGHRQECDQNRLFDEGKSKVQWPKSKHNKMPSRAADVAPYPVIWPNRESKDYFKNLARFYHFAGFVQAHAQLLGLRLRWGGDWDRDFDFKDQRFDDLTHFELMDT